MAICFNLHQVCPFVPPFVFALFFIPSFNVLKRLFLFFTQFGGSSFDKILIKFVTQLLERGNCF